MRPSLEGKAVTGRVTTVRVEAALELGVERVAIFSLRSAREPVRDSGDRGGEPYPGMYLILVGETRIHGGRGRPAGEQRSLGGFDFVSHLRYVLKPGAVTTGLVRRR